MVRCNMYLFMKQGALKATTVILGLLVVSVGCQAILEAELYNTWDDWEYVCHKDTNCPTKWKTYENFFVGVTISFWLLTLINFVSGFFFNLTSSGVTKYADILFQFVAGIFVLTAGIMLLVGARQLDNYLYEKIQVSTTIEGIHVTLGVSCKAYNYGNKLFTGFLAVLNAALYFCTALTVYKVQDLDDDE